MPRSTVDLATEALRGLIARGRYQPGDRLPPERELAQGLGVSRSTMREAIRQLTQASLLQSRRGSGTYVADIDIDAVFAVRLQLEPYAARLAAGQRSSAQAKHLEVLVERLATELDLPAAFVATDVQIHAAITEAAGNPVLIDILSHVIELTRLSREITSPERPARETTLGHLRPLVDAISVGDGDSAARGMESHLNDLRGIARRKSLEFPYDRRLRSAEESWEGRELTGPGETV